MQKKKKKCKQSFLLNSQYMSDIRIISEVKQLQVYVQTASKNKIFIWVLSWVTVR
jgi:hypothetical protein